MATIAKRSRKRKGGRVSTWWEGRLGSDSSGRKVFTGKTRREVEEKIFAYTSQCSNRPHSESTPSRASLDHWVRTVIASTDVAESTARRRLHAWNNRKGDLCDVLLQDLGVADVRAWGVELGLARQERDAAIAWQVLSMACDAAVAEGIMAANPVVQARMYRPRKRRKADSETGRHRVKVYTEVEVARLKNAASRERLGGLIHLLFDTGLRIGEALGLQWRDLDGDSLHVRRALWEFENKLALSAEKTAGSRRSIYADARTVARLGTRQEPAALVFTSTTGGFVRKRAVYRLWQRVHDIAQIDKEGRSPKSARHTHATFLLAAGTPIPDVSRRLGHESIQTTLEFYAAWLPGEDRTKGAVQEILTRATRRE